MRGELNSHKSKVKMSHATEEFFREVIYSSFHWLNNKTQKLNHGQHQHRTRITTPSKTDIITYYEVLI